MSLLSSKDCVTIRHPGQVRLRRTRAGIQEESDYIDISLDSGSRSARRSSSGMTGSANWATDSEGKGDSCEVELLGVKEFYNGCLTSNKSSLMLLITGKT